MLFSKGAKSVVTNGFLPPNKTPYFFGSPTFRMGKYDSHRSIEQGAAAPKLLQCEDPHPLLGVGATPRFGRAWARRFK